MKVKVGAYCRVSTEKDDQLNSLESQKKYFTEYIKTNPDWELADIYADEGISGTQAENRTEFQRMISDARLKRLNLILTKEISRFARNTKVSLDYTRMLKELGVGVLFINDNINTMDGDGELRLTIMSAIAQEESRKTSQRVKWGQKRRMEQGVVFGREPFGYFLCNGVLSINEEEAETVRLIFQKFTLEGKGTHVIARELNEEGIQSKGFKRWTNTAILRLLKNEKYVGDLAQKKTITPDYLNHKKIQNRGQEELVYINNHHTPLISRELWDATQLQLQSRSASKEQRSKYSNRYWCSGKLVCGECGSKLAGRSKKLKNGEVYKAWRCSRARTYGSCRTNSEGDHIGCDNRSISHIALNEIVKFVLASVDLDKERILSELVSEIKKLDESCKVTDTESLYRKIAYLKSKKQEVINLLLEGCISKGDMALMNKKYDSLINNAEKDIKSLEVLSSKGSEKEMTLQVCKGRINSLLNMMTCREMEEVYKQTVNKIILNKDNTVELYLSGIKEPVKLHYASRGRRDNYTVECTFP
ncbi:MAG TPA: recombinase family protein [Ruminiclostridium sp.]|nr:recombinase family protein [Ruminiclostridium sp.]